MLLNWKKDKKMNKELWCYFQFILDVVSLVKRRKKNQDIRIVCSAEGVSGVDLVFIAITLLSKYDKFIELWMPLSEELPVVNELNGLQLFRIID